MAVTATETLTYIDRGGDVCKIKLECVGASGTLTITKGNAALVAGMVLREVITYPTVGGTAPTVDSDLTVLDSHSFDLLGGKGTNLIHDDAELRTNAYNVTSGLYYYPVIDSTTLQVVVANQVVADATFTIELIFTKAI